MRDDKNPSRELFVWGGRVAGGGRVWWRERRNAHLPLLGDKQTLVKWAVGPGYAALVPNKGIMCKCEPRWFRNIRHHQQWGSYWCTVNAAAKNLSGEIKAQQWLSSVCLWLWGIFESYIWIQAQIRHLFFSAHLDISRCKWVGISDMWSGTLCMIANYISDITRFSNMSRAQVQYQAM